MDHYSILAPLTPFLDGQRLSELQLEQVSAYLELLLKWNAKINLTAVRSGEGILARHFGESFFAARTLLRDELAVPDAIDLGSGGGFPGLPMAIYAPLLKITLIESQNKKVTFLKEVIRTLGLRKAEVFGGRAEDYPGKASLVALRAVERFDLAVVTAAERVAAGGRLALMVGIDQTLNLPIGFTWDVSVRVPQSTSQVIAVGSRNQP